MQPDDLIPNTQFSTQDLTASEKYSAWRESIACIFDVDADRETRDEDFYASVNAYLLGDFFLGETSTRGQKFHRTESTIAADGMDHFMVQVYTEGSNALDVKQDIKIQRQGGIVVYDLAKTAKTITSDFTNLSLIIPRNKIDDLLEVNSSSHLRFLPSEQPLTKLLHDNIKLLYDLAPKLTNRQAMTLAPNILNLVVANLNDALETGTDITVGSSSALKIAAKDLIVKRLTDHDLDADQLAQQLGVARSKLYRAFEDQGGVMNFVRGRRLRLAAEFLTHKDFKHLRINEVAWRSGFGNATTFTRAFREHFGVSPRDYRAQSVTLQTASHVETALSGSYGSWLHRL